MEYISFLAYICQQMASTFRFSGKIRSAAAQFAFRFGTNYSKSLPIEIDGPRVRFTGKF